MRQFLFVCQNVTFINQSIDSCHCDLICMHMPFQMRKDVYGIGKFADPQRLQTEIFSRFQCFFLRQPAIISAELIQTCKQTFFGTPMQQERTAVADHKNRSLYFFARLQWTAVRDLIRKVLPMRSAYILPGTLTA